MSDECIDKLLTHPSITARFKERIKKFEDSESYDSSLNKAELRKVVLRRFFSALKMIDTDNFLSISKIVGDINIWDVRNPKLTQKELRAVESFAIGGVYEKIDKETFFKLYHYLGEFNILNKHKTKISQSVQSGKLTREESYSGKRIPKTYGSVYSVINNAIYQGKNNPYEKYDTIFKRNQDYLITSVACYVFEGYSREDLINVIKELVFIETKKNGSALSRVEPRISRLLDTKKSAIKEYLHTGIPLHLLLELED